MKHIIVFAETQVLAFKEWKEFKNKMQSENFKATLLKVERDGAEYTFIYKQKKIKPVQVVIDTKGEVRDITTLKSYTIGFFNGLFIGLIVGFIFLFVIKTGG